MRLASNAGPSGVIAVAAAALVVATAGCASSSAPRTLASAAFSTGSPMVTHRFIGMSALFPATTEDGRLAGEWVNYRSNVRSREIASCMTGRGFPESSKSVTVLPHVEDFPDPDELGRIGFGVVASAREAGPSPLSPTSGMDSSTAAQFMSNAQECTAEAEQPFSAMDATIQPLVQAWRKQLSQVDSAPEVTAAFSTWSACMSAAGLPVADESAFFGLVDARLQPLIAAGEMDAAGALELTLAGAYARCIAPVDTLRDSMRTARRTKFVDENRVGIEEDVSAMKATVSALSERFPDIN